MRIGILGVGAIGGVIGGYLARAGRDVTLIDMWPANVDRIKADGLKVTTIEGVFTVEAPALHLSEVSTARPGFDAAILAMKSYDTRWATTFLLPYLAPGGYIVSAQNGINEDTIAEIAGWTRVVGCVVTLGAGMYEPGHAERTSANDRTAFTVGEPSGLITPRLTGLAEVLGDVGITETTTNLWGHRWGKLATNSMSNALAGCAAMTSAELRDDDEARAISIRIGSELMTVATALGVNVEPIGGIPADLFLRANTDADARERIADQIRAYGRSLGAGRPSLAQDVIKGRSTEVDFLNGVVVRKGKEVGVPTPINEQVVGLTKRVEAGELAPSPSNFQHIDLSV